MASVAHFIAKAHCAVQKRVQTGSVALGNLLANGFRHLALVGAQAAAFVPGRSRTAALFAKRALKRRESHR